MLLSNGNLVDRAIWTTAATTPGWPVPQETSYLFALVAGRPGVPRAAHRARARADHLLQVWVRRGDLDKTEHAMNSLMASVAWDEARFGLSLDLERFMIVAVGDFNMGRWRTRA